MQFVNKRVYLAYMCSPSWREVRAKIQSVNMDTETEAESWRDAAY